jgi:predicted RNA-binding protein
MSMCEFKVVLNGETVFKDVVHAEVKGKSVTVKDVLGQWKEFKNCRILEVDVNSTRLILSAN